MNAFKRNAVIAGAIVRIKCRKLDESKYDEALQESLHSHNVEVTEREWSNLRGDIAEANEGNWPREITQISWLWGKSPLQDDQLRGVEVKA